MQYMNICRVCGHYFSDSAHICPNCSNPVGSVFCYKCGAIIRETDNYCPNCGDDRSRPFRPYERGAKRNPFGPLGVAPDGVEAIDLGLSFRWASCNVGANRPEESGRMYAWGETEERTSCDWSNYSRCGGSKETCYDLSRDIAGTEYDVARVKWRGKWQIPSCQQVEELKDRCTCERISFNGIKGIRCFGPRNNSIFLPDGSYWLSEPDQTNCAHFLTIGENGLVILSHKLNNPVFHCFRIDVKQIRPVINTLSFSRIY